MKEHSVKTIVVGEPKTLKNTDTHSSKIINEFTVHLKRKIPEIDIVRVDERFTSVLAKQSILMSGVGKKKRQNKELVDAVSAAIILQSYLEQKK